MPRRDPRVSEYIQGRAPFARPILRHLRKVIHEASPALEESIRWGMPSFLYGGKIVCGFAGFKAHCALWFWKGAAIVGRKSEEAMGNFGRITSVADLPAAPEIKAYVKKALQLIERRRLALRGRGGEGDSRRRPAYTVGQSDGRRGGYLAMDPLVVLVVLALIATVIALSLGLLAMSSGEAVDREFSTPLMWARVGLQAITIALLAIALFLR